MIMNFFTEMIENIREAIDEKEWFSYVDEDALSDLFEIEDFLKHPAKIAKNLYADIPDSEMDFASHGDLKVFFDREGFFVYDDEENKHYISEKYIKIKPNG